MTGIRLATISTIGITTIAYSIGAGGIGRLLFEGMRQLSYNKIFAGSLLVILQNIILNMMLLWIEKFTTKLLHLP